MKTIRPAALVALCLAACPIPAGAQAYVDLADVEARVARFLDVPAEQAGSAIVSLDRRMKLAVCPMEPALGWYGARRDTVQVLCPVPGGWKLYVRTLGNRLGSAPAEPVVRRGDAVSLTLAGAGFSVGHAAEALDSGAPGEWVRVRVARDAELRAIVQGPGAVLLRLP